MSDQTPKKSNSLVIVVVILAIVAAALGFKYMQESSAKEKAEKENKELTEAKADLTGKLEDQIAAFNRLQTEFGDSSAALASKKAELEKALKDLKNANNKNWNNSKLIKRLKGELASSKALTDSLISANIALKASNDSLNTTLTDVNGKYTSLQGEYNTNMDIAKKLGLSNMMAEGRRVKKNGKFKATTKAKKVNTIHVDFTVNENKLAKSGPTNLYLRLIGPDNSVISIENKGSGKMRLVGDEELEFTDKKILSYANNNTKVTFDWVQNVGFNAGKYTAEIYAEGYKMGTKSFTLE